MRKLLWLNLLLLVLLPMLTWADPVGFGLSGGVLIPVAQEDQSSGTLVAVKIRTRLADMLTLEPNLQFGRYGDVDIGGLGTRDGSSLKSYGVDITFGDPMMKIGLKPYLFIGGAVYNTKRDGDLTTNKSGWSFGTGLALAINPKFDIDLRGRFNIAASEESTSRKAIGVTAGITYYVGSY
jgi:hypothetical protein